MERFSRHWLLTASLVSLLGSPFAALAQAGRPWVDPPAEVEVKAQAPVSSPVPGAAPAQATISNPPHPSPQQASVPPSPKMDEEARVQAQPTPEASQRQAAKDPLVKQKMASERKARTPTQRASSWARSQRPEGQVARRGTSTRVSQAESAVASSAVPGLHAMDRFRKDSMQACK